MEPHLIALSHLCCASLARGFYLEGGGKRKKKRQAGNKTHTLYIPSANAPRLELQSAALSASN